MIYAIIDIGSSTVRLAIYRIDIESSGFEMLMKKKVLLGLATYLRSGRMTDEGIARTIETLRSFQAFLAPLPIAPEHVTAFTTAALRNARNSKAAIAAIEEATGIPVRILSGDEEATYDFIGATRGLGTEDGLLVDIGGASLEIVHFLCGEIERKISLPIGSTLYASTYVAHFLPTATEAAEMQRAAERALSEAPDFAGLGHPEVCGIGGTFKGADMLHQELYRSESGTPIPMEHIAAMIHRFDGEKPLSEENAMHLMRCVPDRMRSVVPGMAIAAAVLAHFGSKSVRYSDSGVREGYICREILGE